MPAETILIWGHHAVRAALRNAPERMLEAWADTHLQSGEVAAFCAALARLGVAVQRVPRPTLDQLSGGGRHQGIVVRRRLAPPITIETLCEEVSNAHAPCLLLILDGVQDPQNLGACLRVADAAGARAVVVPKDRAAGRSGAVFKAASGAGDTIPLVTVTNLARAMDELKAAGVWLIGATQDAAQSLYAVDLSAPLGVVLGGEERGLRRLTRERCDHLVAIPMRGGVESLNVATAAAVCLFEANRQREVAQGADLP
jgi:23S rRNA (guanosine2251-2'-O)-methyltransferase